MKKKKPSERVPADFKHTPFKSLKGFAPQPDVDRNKPALPRRKKEEPEDEAHDLFLRAVAGARKIEEERVGTPAEAVNKTAGKPENAPPRDGQLFLRAMQKMGTTFREPLPREREDEEADPERRSSSSRLKQLKRGVIRISAELDLHGYMKDEALQKLDRFIRHASLNGQQAVLVITGKGINSPEGPVLQGAVASWLRERGKGTVAEFAPAPRDKGGSGAFVVFLKKK